MISRTQQAVEWLDAAKPSEPRTQTEAAERFGITQPTIAAAIARHRQTCALCGKRVKPVAGRAIAPTRAVLAPTIPDARLGTLARAVGTYAWHLGECPAYDGVGACSCGFEEVESMARGIAV